MPSESRKVRGDQIPKDRGDDGEWAPSAPRTRRRTSRSIAQTAIPTTPRTSRSARSSNRGKASGNQAEEQPKNLSPEPAEARPIRTKFINSRVPPERLKRPTKHTDSRDLPPAAFPSLPHDRQPLTDEERAKLNPDGTLRREASPSPPLEVGDGAGPSSSGIENGLPDGLTRLSLSPSEDVNRDSTADFIRLRSHSPRSPPNPPLSYFFNRDYYPIMTENIPPASFTGSGASNDDSTRGLPYYESLKKDLRANLKKKMEMEDNLAKIEAAIWAKEGTYLEETMVAGNILKGFDGYVKASGSATSAGAGATSSRRKATASDHDRLFSRSSVGYWTNMRENSPQPSTHSTPSHAPTPVASGALKDTNPTPTSAVSTKGPNMKKVKKADKDKDKEKDRAGEDDEDTGKPPNKRLKISYARSEREKE